MHPYKEGIVIQHLKNVLLLVKLLHHSVFNYIELAHGLHRKQLVCLLLLHEVHFPKRTLAEDPQYFEVCEAS